MSPAGCLEPACGMQGLWLGTYIDKSVLMKKLSPFIYHPRVYFGSPKQGRRGLADRKAVESTEMGVLADGGLRVPGSFLCSTVCQGQFRF